MISIFVAEIAFFLAKQKTHWSLMRRKSDNEYINSGKIPYIIYAELQSLIREIDGRANNSE